jgi:Tfp pilus assembly PilM family ATPase
MLGLQPKFPHVAIEIGEGYASAVRLQRGRSRPSIAEWFRIDFPARPAEPEDIGGALLLDDDLRIRLRDLAEKLGRVRRLSLVLPDAAVRTFFLELENPSATGKELHDMVRFKLSRLVPINLDGAALAYQRLQTGSGAVNFLALLTSRRMISGFEDFFRARGTHLGLIETASLAAANLLTPSLPEAVNFTLVRVGLKHFTIALFLGGQLAFGRTRRLDSPQAAATIQQELRTISLFAQDKLGSAGVQKVYLHGPGLSDNGFSASLAKAGFDAHELDLEDFIDLTPDLRGRLDDQGTILAAAGAATRSR